MSVDILLLLYRLRKEVEKDLGLGLCTITTDLYYSREINAQEWQSLYDYLDKYRPKEIVYDIHFSWPLGEMEPRLKWLDERIAHEESLIMNSSGISTLEELEE